VFVAQPGRAPTPVRVNPEGLVVESLHQPPGLALGPRNEVYVSWSSPKPVPEGGLFASDLRLSRSLDGGRTFDSPLRVNEDRPISHSFEGLGVTPDGTVIVAWIDSRAGANAARTCLARITERGSRVEPAVKLDDGETCVCCRVDVAAEPARNRRGGLAEGLPRQHPRHGRRRVARRRALVRGARARSRRSLADQRLSPSRRQRRDGRPGSRLPRLAWYTETADGQPRMLFAASPDGQRFAPPSRLSTAAGYVPDQVRLAADETGAW
jgi:hypothetical protein